MRVYLLLGWLMLPIVALAFHWGPGQEQQTLDDAGRMLAKVERLVAAKEWEAVVANCDDALKALPKNRVADGQRIVLERAKARMFIKQLPVAHDELKGLVDDLQSDPTTDPGLLTDAQAALANADYYMTWLMRLEGKPREAWEPAIEASRQTFRLLAEQAEAADNELLARRHREDLQSAIRLARMDLSELQGLPLPSQ
jgi:hypothetical protein